MAKTVCEDDAAFEDYWKSIKYSINLDSFMRVGFLDLELAKAFTKKAFEAGIKFESERLAQHFDVQ